MTAIIEPIPISNLPPAPLPGDDPATFDSKSFPLVAALQPLVNQTNASVANVFNNATAADERATDSESARDAAVLARNAAQTAQGLAEGARDTAVTARNQAVSARDDAVPAAATATSARDDAVLARNAAQAAQGLAEQYRDDAQMYATEQLIATSSTSVTPGAGSKSLTIQPDKAFIVGMYLVATSAGNPTDYMAGTVSSYNRTTGALVLDVDDFEGTSARADWSIGITGRSGGGGMTTQVVTSNTTCVAGVMYIVAAAGITLTLPTSWTLGDRIGFREAIGEPNTYTIGFGSTPVRGVAQGSATILAQRSGVDFTYQDGTRGLV